MLFSSKVITFLIGALMGGYIYLVTFWNSSPAWEPVQSRRELIRNHYRSEYEDWLKKRKGVKVSNDSEELEYRFLFNHIKITCVVFVENTKNAYLIHNTWGPQCNELKFFSKLKDNFIETTVIKYVNRWQYFCDALRHLWINSKRLEWVVFSLDDVYLIPGNLRYFVATKNYDEAFYFGHNSMFWQQLYNSDKTSFVLSRGAISSLMKKFNSSERCLSEGKDINLSAYNLGIHSDNIVCITLGKELSRLGILAADSRDQLGRERFHTFTLERLITNEYPSLIHKYSKTSLRPVKQGPECCSETSISFRSVQSDRIYFYHYLLYNVRLPSSLAPPLTSQSLDQGQEVWTDFVREELGPDVNLTGITNQQYYELWRRKIWEPEEFNRKLKEQIMLSINKLL